MSTTVQSVLFVVETNGISYGNIKYNSVSMSVYNASARKQRPRERPSMLVV